MPSTVDQYRQEVPVFASKEEELAYNATKPIYHLEDGKVVGEHQGAHYFTKGQRKGLDVGGTKEPLFVIETDVEENVIYTGGQGKAHPGLTEKRCSFPTTSCIGYVPIWPCNLTNNWK